MAKNKKDNVQVPTAPKAADAPKRDAIAVVSPMRTVEVLAPGEMPRQPWHRQAGETVVEYGYFKLYCQQDKTPTRRAKRERSLVRLCAHTRKSYTYISKLSSEHRWQERVDAYDEYMLELDQQQREHAMQVENEKWAARRTVIRDKEWEMSEKLLAMAEEMIDIPVFRERIEHQDQLTVEGYVIKQIIIREPADWSLSDLAKVLELASKLARLAAGMETARTRTKIDLSTMSDEELMQLVNGD